MKTRANRQPELPSESENEEEEGPSPKVEKALTKEKCIEILKTQKVLSGSVFLS